MGYIFISYSSKNQPSADALRKLFNTEGIKTWMAPGDIPAGSSYMKEITNALKNCSCLLLLLSSASQNSTWVLREVERAISYKKAIIPVQIESVILNDEFELVLGPYHVVAVQKIDPNSIDVRKVLNSIKSIIETGEKNENGNPTLTISNEKTNRKNILKRTVCIACIFIVAIAVLLFSLFVLKSNNPDWKSQYCSYIQSALDNGTLITGAWIYDVDGDGVPMVALSTSQATHRIPNIVINYKDGQLIVKDDIKTIGTGGAVLQKALFREGTNSFVVTMQGMTEGTWANADIEIYEISNKGYTYSQEYRSEIYTYDLEGEFETNNLHSIDDVNKYISAVTDRINDDIEKYYGENNKLLNYNDYMTVFDITFDGFQSRDKAVQMRVPVSYLEKELGIKLSINEDNYSQE